MCGISGYYGLDDPESIKKMIKSLNRRGPEHTAWVNTNIGSIANARLSIIDVEGGNQPIWNENNDVCIVANCEIYNFKELREELERKNHKFKTKTDTEVILYAYIEYNLEFASKIDGIFAIAILDLRLRKMILCRDRLGIKPLYYAQKNGLLLFGSEIKAITEFEGVQSILDLNNLNHFLNFGYIYGDKSLFKGIKQLLPSTIMEISQNGIKLQKYWDIDITSKNQLDLKILFSLLDKAVESQLISERPLGVYLSGGLDSSIVASLAAKKLDKLSVFTQRFGEVDEVTFASQVAEQIGAEHYIEKHDPETEIKLVREMIHIMEHPTFGLSPTYQLAKFARSKGNIVMLSGLGGDEVFGGYTPHLRAVKIANLPNLRVIGRFGGSIFRKIGRYNLARYAMSFGSTQEKILAIKTAEDENKIREFFIEDVPKIDWEDYLRYQKHKDFFRTMETELIYSQLDGNYLKIADRMSMAASLEMRVPLLDTSLVEYGLSLPREAKIRNGVTKYALRRIAKDFIKLPEAIIKRGEDPKTKGGYGFSAMEFWNKGLREYVECRLDRSVVNEHSIFNFESVNTYLKKADSFVKIRLLWHLATTHDMIELFDMKTE